MTEAAPLNLLNLAKAEPGRATSALAQGLSVQALSEPLALDTKSLWLLVLEGELIVDLPHGDFRVLKVGDSLQLRGQLTLTPLQQTVFLFSRG